MTLRDDIRLVLKGHRTSMTVTEIQNNIRSGLPMTKRERILLHNMVNNTLKRM